MMLTIEDIVNATNGTLLVNKAKVKGVVSVSIDSRTINERELFVAIRGDKHLAVHFLLAAWQKGVRHFLIDNKDVNHPQVQEIAKKSVCVVVALDVLTAYQSLASFYLEECLTAQKDAVKIAITGSVGKTTTKEMLALMLSSRFSVFYSEKNENNHIGVPKNIFRFKPPTSGKPIAYIFELGMNHALEIECLSAIIKPDISVITNILPVHIEHLHSTKNIARAKSEIFKHQTKEDWTFLNQKSAYISVLKKNSNHLAKNRCWFSPTAVKVLFVDRQAFLYYTATKNMLPISMKNVLGFLVNAPNVSAALSVASHLGISIEMAFKSLTRFQFPSRRLEILTLTQRAEEKKDEEVHFPLIVDDAYNANATSIVELVRAVHLFAKLLPHDAIDKNNANIRLHLVIGDILELGNREKTIHTKLGKKLSTMLTNIEKKSRVKNFFSQRSKAHSEQFIECFVYCVGKAMKTCYDNIILKNKFHYQQKESERLLQAIDKHMKADARQVVVFKASNGMQFDVLIKDMCKKIL